METEKIVEMELRAMIESNALMIAETKRIWGSKENITDYEKGRAEGIILVSLDILDNLKRFWNNIGLKKPSHKESRNKK